MGSLLYQLVQDFFHQQYGGCWNIGFTLRIRLYVLRIRHYPKPIHTNPYQPASGGYFDHQIDLIGEGVMGFLGL